MHAFVCPRLRDGAHERARVARLALIAKIALVAVWATLLIDVVTRAAADSARRVLSDGGAAQLEARLAGLTVRHLRDAVATRAWRRELIDPLNATWTSRADGAAVRDSIVEAVRARPINATDRRGRLGAYFRAKFPNVDLPGFRAWSRRVFNAYAKALGLAERDWANSVDHVEHRSLMLGLNAAKVLASNRDRRIDALVVGSAASAIATDSLVLGLTKFSALDPIETTAFTGFVPSLTFEERQDDSVRSLKPSEDVDDWERRFGLVPNAMIPDTRLAPNVPGEASSSRASRRRRHRRPQRTAPPTTSTGSIPANFDLRARGAVTAVRDQGACGSCWAFAAAEAVESRLRLSGGGPLLELSAQHILSCNGVYSQCDGGDAGEALRWVAKQPRGLVTEAAYPYFAGLNCDAQGVCRTQPCDRVKSAKGVVRLSSQAPVALRLTTEAQVQRALMSKGAVVITLSAQCLYEYRAGVITPANCKCPSTYESLDHQALLVGWTPTYWIVRNQWSASWGERGYFRIARGTKPNGNGLCGLMLELLLPSPASYEPGV